MKKYIWVLVYALVLASFTVYSVLDTFVISRSYTQIPEDSQPALSDQRQNTQVKASYKDKNISIQIVEYREFDTNIYVADVVLCSPEYLKTALAHDKHGKNVTELTSSIAKRKNAILAINGDYYGAREQGYIMRNGNLLRDKPTDGLEDLVIYQNGAFEIINESERTAKELVDAGAVQILSFGPGLIKNSEIAIDPSAMIDHELTSNPRTAVGVISELHYVFVVSDGRWKDSKGLSLYELAQFMQSLNVKTAYNLDGGGSSTMCFNGEYVNRPTNRGQKIEERSVSDIVYIGY